jgi:hypothetical protein
VQQQTHTIASSIQQWLLVLHWVQVRRRHQEAGIAVLCEHVQQLQATDQENANGINLSKCKVKLLYWCERKRHNYVSTALHVPVCMQCCWRGWLWQSSCGGGMAVTNTLSSLSWNMMQSQQPLAAHRRCWQVQRTLAQLEKS